MIHVRASLMSHCRDRQSGGLGNFIEILELLFSQIRPEWKAISFQMIRNSGRILHTHSEAVQSYTSIKPSKFDGAEIESFEEMKHIDKLFTSTLIDSAEDVDISTLEPVRVDMATLQDVIRHKMQM